MIRCIFDDPFLDPLLFILCTPSYNYGSVFLERATVFGADLFTWLRFFDEKTLIIPVELRFIVHYAEWAFFRVGYAYFHEISPPHSVFSSFSGWPYFIEFSIRESRTFRSSISERDTGLFSSN